MTVESARVPPERRRVLIIGAGPTGMSVAFHLGEHSLLLEQRASLENGHHDYPHTFPVGPAHARGMGGEDACTNGDGYSPRWGNKALFISCSSGGKPEDGEHSLIHVQRWQPPDLAPRRWDSQLPPPPSVRTVSPLLRGELRMGARVVCISPASHLAELADGHRYVYDMLVSTLSLEAIARLVLMMFRPTSVTRFSSVSAPAWRRATGKPVNARRTA